MPAYSLYNKYAGKSNCFFNQQQQSSLLEPNNHITAMITIIIHIVLPEPNQELLLQPGLQQGLHGVQQSLTPYPSPNFYDYQQPQELSQQPLSLLIKRRITRIMNHKIVLLSPLQPLPNKLNIPFTSQLSFSYYSNLIRCLWYHSIRTKEEILK